MVSDEDNVAFAYTITERRAAHSTAFPRPVRRSRCGACRSRSSTPMRRSGSAGELLTRWGCYSKLAGWRRSHTWMSHLLFPHRLCKAGASFRCFLQMFEPDMFALRRKDRVCALERCRCRAQYFYHCQKAHVGHSNGLQHGTKDGALLLPAVYPLMFRPLRDCHQASGAAKGRRQQCQHRGRSTFLARASQRTCTAACRTASWSVTSASKGTNT